MIVKIEKEKLEQILNMFDELAEKAKALKNENTDLKLQLEQSNQIQHEDINVGKLQAILEGFGLSSSKDDAIDEYGIK